jgi:hypothetical protein
MPDSNKREVKNCDPLSEHVKAGSGCAKRVGAIQRIAQGIKRMPMPSVGKGPQAGIREAWCRLGQVLRRTWVSAFVIPSLELEAGLDSTRI